MLNQIFLGPRGPLLYYLWLLDPYTRPPARISPPPSSLFPPSPPPVPSPLVTPVTLVTPPSTRLLLLLLLFEGTGLLQIIIQRGRSLANDHSEGPVSCKWLSRWTGFLQMIIWRGRPLANDHPERPASCKWSTRGAVTPLTLVTSARIRIQSGGPF